MHSARIVAEHPADRAAAVRCRIGAEDEPVLSHRAIHLVEHDTGLDAHQFPLHVDVEDAVVILRAIDDDRDVAALPGETRAAAAAGDRCAKFPASRDRRDDVGAIARQNDANWDLAIIRAVGGIQCPVAVAEADFAADGGAQFFFQTARVHVRGIDGVRAVRGTRFGFGDSSEVHMISFVISLG